MNRAPGPQAQPEPEAYRVLVVGGTDGDRAALQAGLSGRNDPRVLIEQVDRPESAVVRAEAPPAAVVLDISAPAFSQPEARQRIRRRWPGVPIIVLADPAQEELASIALDDGAQDYLLRGRSDPELIRRVLGCAIRRQRRVGELEDRVAGLERRVAELEPNEVRFRRLIERNADGIVIVDDAGTIRFVNPAAEKLFDRAADQLVGALFGFPVVTGERTEIDIVRHGGELITAELRAVSTVWQREKACLISLRDITDRKRAEEKERQLVREQSARAAAEQAEHRYRRLAEESAALAAENARLYEESQQANRAKSDFLAVMSHELRTPLNAIIGYADLLGSGLGGPVNDRQRGQLERIAFSARHLVQIVAEILSFARMESGREGLQASPVDCGTLVTEIGALIEPLARDKGLAFRTRVAAEPAVVETDPAKLRQVLLNLLSNAVKFTEQGEVRLELEAEPDRLVFRVADTGIGIPAEHLDAIWEPFWQVEQAQTRTVGGTGLGLSVAKRLVELLGGEIRVETAPGTGSTFVVLLPSTSPPSPPPPS